MGRKKYNNVGIGIPTQSMTYSQIGNVSRVVYTIPVGNVTENQARSSLRDLMSSYTEPIDRDNSFEIFTISSTNSYYEADRSFNDNQYFGYERYHNPLRIRPSMDNNGLASFRYKEKSRMEKFLNIFKWRKLK